MRRIKLQIEINTRRIRINLESIKLIIQIKIKCSSNSNVSIVPSNNGKNIWIKLFSHSKTDSYTKPKKKISRYYNILLIPYRYADRHTTCIRNRLQKYLFLFFALIHSRFSFFFFFFFVFLYVEIYYNRVLKSHSTKVSQPIIISSSVFFFFFNI